MPLEASFEITEATPGDYKVEVFARSNEISKALFFDSIRKDRALIAGHMTAFEGKSLPLPTKSISVQIDPFSKVIDLKDIRKLSLFGRTYYCYADWRRDGVAFEINIKSGQFILYVDDITLDDSKPTLQSEASIKLDDFTAIGTVIFNNVRKHNEK